LSELTVEFAGEVHRVSRQLTFGRAGDLPIDDNQYMHRWVGEFLLDGGYWWLANRGSRIPLTLISGDGKWVQLPPGSTQALAEGSGVVRFRAGQANYELSYHGAPPGPGAASAPQEEGGDQTLRFKIELTPREVDYMVSFCAPQFSQVANSSLPTYAQVAERWGVSVKTVDNALQNLRRKIREAGLTGAESSDGLAAFMLAHGLILQSDLDWAALDEPEGPRPAADGPRFSATA